MNCTLPTATLSDAVADTVTAEPDTVAPPNGAFIDTTGGCESPPPLPPGLARISTAARFQRSAVGAVSFTVTGLPLAATAAEVICDHNVSPVAESTH